jgi:hypothetical protein
MASMLFRHALLLALTLCCAMPAAAQIPDRFTNLQVLPQTISRDSLVDLMRSFSFALGVRCQYCHVGGDGISFEGVRFPDDDDEDKRKARVMLQLVQRVNNELATLPARDQPPVNVQCVTCHRGLQRPRTLEAELATTIARAGIDSAIVHYRTLRNTYFGSGSFDFGAQRLIEVARALFGQQRGADAERMLQLNLEFYANHAGTYGALAELRLLRADTTGAIAALERLVELQPQDQAARQRLLQLRRR